MPRRPPSHDRGAHHLHLSELDWENDGQHGKRNPPFYPRGAPESQYQYEYYYPEEGRDACEEYKDRSFEAAPPRQRNPQSMASKGLTSQSSSTTLRRMLNDVACGVFFMLGVSLFSLGVFVGQFISTPTIGGPDTTTKIISNQPYTFDKMHSQLYQIASKPHGTERKRYHLGAVKETEGGLVSTDRELLAGMYLNASSVFEFGLGESTHIAGYIGVPRSVAK